MRHNEPKWIPTDDLRHGNLPAELLSWLLYQKSLTQRIQRACPGDFAVQVVSQAWQRPLFSERQALLLNDRETCLIRQVRLLCDDQAWVFARTVIPASTLTGPRRQLQRLGNRPLGAMLFADRRIQRRSSQLARLVPGHAVYALATAGLDHQPGAIWGRRAAYLFAGRGLLVNEIFLPACLQHSRQGCRQQLEPQTYLIENRVHAC